MKNHFLSKCEQLTVTMEYLFLILMCCSKILLQFFDWQNHIRPLSEQCTVREFEIEMSLSMTYI